jgi:hypothetical protein
VQVYLDFNACFILKIGNNKLNRNCNAKKLTNFPVFSKTFTHRKHKTNVKNRRYFRKN